MLKLIFALSAATLLAPTTARAASQSRDFVQRGADWFIVDRGREYRVAPDLVSVRLHAPAENFGAWAAQQPSAHLLEGLTVLRSNRLGVVDLQLPAGRDVFGVLAALRASADVDFAEAVTIGSYHSTPNDPLLFQQYYLVNEGQAGCTPGADIDADLAWELTTGDPSIVVAVVDSGTDINHDDLAGAIWQNAAEIQGNSLDDDGNGFTDDIVGWNFETNSGNVVTGFFHGTAVAGVVGMRSNNGIGMAGVAGGDGSAGSGCRMMPLPVGEFGPVSSLIDDAVLYALDNGASVITLSLSAAQSTALDMAFEEAAAQGVFVNNASGNGLFGPGAVSYPASHPDVVSVAGTDCNDNQFSVSNQGPENWIAAGGQDIATLDLGNAYLFTSGTSFASPQVAGAAALMLSLLPSLTPDEIKAVLRDTADDLGAPGFDEVFGWGRLDLFEALVAVANGDCDGNGVWDATDVSNGVVADANGNGVPDACEALTAGAPFLSLAAGGSQDLTLNAGPAFAGDFYVLLGSATGTQPGIALPGGLTLPLNFDFYTQITLESSNTVNFVNTVGVLSPSGQASASIVLPAVPAPALQGLNLHHAFLVSDSATTLFTAVSNAVRLDLIP